MTDRELLELAAKAAGLPHQWCDAWNTMAKPRPDGGFFFDKVWTPLTDDGDALRLAVRCAQRFGLYRFMRAWLIAMATEQGDASDSYAATRRAIVRAAAEIGRSKT
jgi:hypothetical protein